MTTKVGLFNGVSVISMGGVPVDAAQKNTLGGIIINPFAAEDQGLDTPEILYVDPVNPANLGITATTVAIQPGQTFSIPPGSTKIISANAASTGHKFTTIVYQSAIIFPPIPTTGAFPPSGPTTMLTVIPSYLYQEYSDDSDLQSFVTAYNGYAQDYIDTFNGLNLPVYTGSNISGNLLDWVAEGLYGITRTALSSGQSIFLGPLDTYEFNVMEMNQIIRMGPDDVQATNDDTFKRIITWHFYKDDGKVFNVRWLKRRVMRFLIGVDGSAPNIDETYQVSVTFGPGNEAAIRFIDSITEVTGGAIFNDFEMNTTMFNELDTERTALTPLPYREIFKEAVDSGVLELPFQYDWTVVV